MNKITFSIIMVLCTASVHANEKELATIRTTPQSRQIHQMRPEADGKFQELMEALKERKRLGKPAPYCVFNDKIFDTAEDFNKYIKENY